MRRFFIAPSEIKDSEGYITGDEAHHMLHVLRLKVGCEIELYDGAGNIYQSSITSTGKNDVCVLINTVRKVRESPPFLHLGFALLTGKKLELVLQKTTELGVKSIQPFTSRFNNPKGISRNKEQRWQKISTEACKQCGRSEIPEIRPLCTFDNIINGAKNYDLKVIFYENEKTLGLNAVQDIILEKKPASAIVLIGPEGGFSVEEIEKAAQQDFIAIGLGPLILRAETAAISGVTLLQYLLGKLNPGIS